MELNGTSPFSEDNLNITTPYINEEDLDFDSETTPLKKNSQLANQEESSDISKNILSKASSTSRLQRAGELFKQIPKGLGMVGAYLLGGTLAVIGGAGCLLASLITMLPRILLLSVKLPIMVVANKKAEQFDGPIANAKTKIDTTAKKIESKTLEISNHSQENQPEQQKLQNELKELTEEQFDNTTQLESLSRQRDIAFKHSNRMEKVDRGVAHAAGIIAAPVSLLSLAIAKLGIFIIEKADSHSEHNVHFSNLKKLVDATIKSIGETAMLDRQPPIGTALKEALSEVSETLRQNKIQQSIAPKPQEL